MDSSKQEDWEAAIAAVEERFGRLDVLINNGGVISLDGIEAAEMDDWNRIVSINQTGTWLGMKQARTAGRIERTAVRDGSSRREMLQTWRCGADSLRGVTRSFWLSPHGLNRDRKWLRWFHNS